MLCCAVLCCVVLCCAVLCCAVLCCAVLCCAVLCCAVLCCAMLCCVVLCCVVLCCAVLCCVVLCCAVLCCVVLYCIVLYKGLCLSITDIFLLKRRTLFPPSSLPPNSQKRPRPISSHLDRTSLVNEGFIIWLLETFFLREAAGSPERAR